MRSFLGQLSLKRRITVSVAVGLASILIVFGYVSRWSVQQTTEQIYREREALALTSARYADSLMYHAQVQLAGAAAIVAETTSLDIRKIALASNQSRIYARVSLFENGNLVWQEPPEAPSDGIESWPCVKESNVSGLPAAGTIVRGLRDRPAGCIAVSLPDGRGLLVAEMDPLADSLRLVPFGSGEGNLLIELVDKSGAILASSVSGERSVVADHMHLLRSLIETKESGVRVHEMPSGSSRPSHLVAYAPMSSVPGWGIMVEQDEDVALALPRSLEINTLVFGAIVLLLGSVLAWTDVRRVVQPLEMLTTASARMAAGDLETPITTTRQDELGELARTFDLMRLRLRQSLDEIGRWNQQLELRVRQRTEELTALFEASQALAVTSSLIHDERETYSQLTAKIAGAVGANKCLIALLDNDDEMVGQSPGYGIEDTAAGRLRYRSPVLESAAILMPGRVSLGDVSHGRRFLDSFGCEAVIAVPLRVEGRATGIIFAADKDGGFDEHDTRLLTIMASQAAVVVENARLYAELQRKEEMRRQLLDQVIQAQEEERKRISRELHDDVGQVLTALVMNVGTMEASMPSRLTKLRKQMTGVRELASDTLSAIRRLMLDLRPTLLDDLGLIPAISWYADNNLARAGIKSHVEVAGFQGRRLPLQLETVLFRVVQEAITNIVKHSGATEATISLELAHGSITTLVKDNGKGFDISGRSSGYQGGLGLMGMRERVGLLGGRLEIDSRLGRGTRLIVQIPVIEGSG